MLVHFREAAEDLIKEKGAVDALAAALASISGQTEIKSRSLISSQEVSHHLITLSYKLVLLRVAFEQFCHQVIYYLFLIDFY